jgi:hypothetical protein
MAMNNTTLLTQSVYDNNSQSILELSRYNGRINIIEPENPDARFQMQEKNAVRNKATPYNEALTGQIENNVLSQVFFSAENIQIIQNGLRAGVYKLSDNKFVIPQQNIDTLKTVMRVMFLQYAEYHPNGITQQVERLNKIVLDYVIPSVYGESLGYLKYLQDQSTLVVPIQLPIQADRVYKQLELKPWF